MNVALRTFLFASLMAALPVLAQAGDKAKVWPSGVRAVVGMVAPDDADADVLFGGDISLGTIWQPWLQLSAGATRWSTDLDASAFGDRNGTLSDLRLFTSVGVEFWEVSGLQGYLDFGLGAHFLDAKFPNDSQLGDAVSGTNFGGEVGYGLASTAGALRISAEIRREFVDDASNWSFMLGVGTRWDEKKKDEPEDRKPVDTSSMIVPQQEAKAERISDLERENVALRNERDAAAAKAASLEENQKLRADVQELARMLFEFRESASRAELERLRVTETSLRTELEETREKTLNDSRIEQTKNGLLLSIRSSLLFASAEAKLEPGGMAELAGIAEVVERFPSARVIVEGHTDSSGDKSENLLLSQQRANAVRSALIQSGLLGENITAVGFGDDVPASTNSTAEGRAANRRVIIRVLPPMPHGETR